MEHRPRLRLPRVVLMVVEVPKNSSNKYEYDPDLRLFKLDRPLYSPMHFPGDYGFIPGTLSEDDEPIDVLALVEEPSFPGCVYRVRPVAMMDVIEESKHDRKILAVPERSPRHEEIRGLEDVAPHILTEIEHFLKIYKELESKPSQIEGWRDARAAHTAIEESRGRYTKLREAESRAR